MPDQSKQGIARWGSLPIEERFKAATANLSHEECMRILPMVKRWVAQKEREYAKEGNSPRMRMAQ